MSVSSWLWFLMCASGCCYQSVILTMQYSYYDVASDVQFKFDPWVRVPAINVCIPSDRLLNWSHPLVRENCRELMGRSCHNMTDQRLIDTASKKHLPRTAASIFGQSNLFKLTVDYESLNGFMLISRNQKNIRQQCFDQSDVITGDDKCTTLTWKRRCDLFNSHELRDGSKDSRAYVKLVHGRELVARTRTYEYALSDNRIPRLRRGVTAFVPAPSNAMIVSSYNEYQSYLLLPPYSTACLNYETIGYTDQAGCMDSCREQIFMTKFGGKSSMQRHYLNDSKSRVELAGKRPTLQELPARMLEATRLCMPTCDRKDCIQKTFMPVTLATYALTDSDGISAHVFKIPTSPTLVTMAFPKVRLVEFVTMIASCFGFWFGLSALQMFHVGRKTVRRCLRIRKRRQTEQTIVRLIRAPVAVNLTPARVLLTGTASPH